MERPTDPRPVFYCYDQDDMGPEDAIRVRAWSHEEAARHATQRWDADGGYLDERSVMVRKDGETEWKRFKVTAEADVVYTAYEGDADE